MLIHHEIKIDLSRRDAPERLDVMQCDENTREVAISLYNAGISWEVPAGAHLAVAFEKPDKKSGWYDTLEDGSAACSVEGSQLLVKLAPQMLTAVGIVKAVVVMEGESKQLTTFDFEIRVVKNPRCGAVKSTDYVNMQQWMLDKVREEVDALIVSGELVGPPGPQGPVGPIGPEGPQGVGIKNMEISGDGQLVVESTNGSTTYVGAVSAYGIAVEEGFEGTVKEWLESLQGEGAVTDAQIAEAVGDYMEENPIDVDLTGYATTKEMEEKIALQGESFGADIMAVRTEAKEAKAIAEQALEQGGGGGSVATLTEPADGDIPKVFFGGALQQTKDEAVVPFRYISKTQDISGYAEIKAQGNSSMSYPKKNQTVKLFKDAECTEKLKVDFKGWGKQNKHVYKANWIDLSHARNVVSARLWADVVKSRANYAELPEELRTSPNQGAVDGFPVKVYAAGVYQGRYTINIPKDKWMVNMDDDLETHCILCGENYASGCFRAAAVINGSDWTDELHDTVPTSIKNRWNEIISFVMNSTDEEFRANLGNYFFVDSLIDYHLFGLASCGLDAYGKNQLYLTYDGQKWIADMYDMDSSWGLYWNGSQFVATDYSRTSYEDFTSTQSSGDGNLLYIRLEQMFWAELQSRWAELKAGALSIENIINRFERFTDIAPAELVAEDYASTSGGGKFTGIPSKTTNNIQQIRAFALARQAWTDNYVAELNGENGGNENPEAPDHTHSYNSSVTTAATCTSAGVRTYTCSCGDSYTEEFPALGHSYSGGICTRCGEEEIIDYTANALANATWLEGYAGNRGTGVIAANADSHITEPITLQNCTYRFTPGAGNTYCNVFVYDENNNFICAYEQNAGWNIHAVSGYKYRIQVYSQTGAYSNATLVPIDNSATATYTVVNLAEQTWQVGTYGAEIILPASLGLSDAIEQTDRFMFGKIVDTTLLTGGSAPLNFVLSSYAGVLYLHAPYFKSAAEASAYFTENNTVLVFNERCQ